LASSKLDGRVLTMRPGKTEGSWIPATVADSRLLFRVQTVREGSTVNHPARDLAGYLLALCASRGVAVLFDPSTYAREAPSPSPRPGQGSRRNGLPHR
jgi:hypothetical protein